MDCNKYSIKNVLISQERISAELVRVGEYIDRKYDGKPLLIVGILKGSFVFLGDLAKTVTIPCRFGFMAVQSYSGTESTGEINITLDLQQDISAYHVVIAEDIIDTGCTLRAVADILRKRNPLSLEIITLLDKPDRREADIQADYSMFTIPDSFVVGYGLDYDEYYRNLPYIAEI
ncbi:MAG: hypoxanthine phosphoribosyltransferase [Ruminococcus flavefaciens]|nr:hypoxanthine phosphoribosyltransferase [Ruminococcus flavefaciens]MCM1229335.1 hypoxanthine phosphoribosyltransferase [Ruminococcus flavefaciens]